jgi:hypothetical protein
MERGGGGAFERERRKPGTGANDPWASWTRKGSERGGLGLKERKGSGPLWPVGLD